MDLHNKTDVKIENHVKNEMILIGAMTSDLPW